MATPLSPAGFTMAEHERAHAAVAQALAGQPPQVRCARCGNLFDVALAGTSATVRCRTTGCLEDRLRGLLR